MRQYGLPFTATIKALLVLVTADFAPVPNMTTLQLFGGYHQGQKSGTSRTTPETLTQTTSYNPNFEPEAQNDPHTPNTAQPTKQRPPPPPQKKKKKQGISFSRVICEPWRTEAMWECSTLYGASWMPAKGFGMFVLQRSLVKVDMCFRGLWPRV